MLDKKIDNNYNLYLSLNDVLTKYNSIYSLPKIKSIKIKMKTDNFNKMLSTSLPIKDNYYVIIFLFYFLSSKFPFIYSFENIKLKEKNKSNNYFFQSILYEKNNISTFLERLFFDILKDNKCEVNYLNLSLLYLKVPIFFFQEIEFINNLEKFNSLFKNFDIEIFFYIKHNKKNKFKNINKMIPYLWHI